jgi:Cof subfamily protein (haloacid dehalogenase superfamily)
MALKPKRNPPQKVRLVALDIDGTLLDMPSRFSVPSEVRAAVAQARAQGVQICLCSSRLAHFTESVAAQIGGCDLRIGSAGAEIQMQDGKLCVVSTISESAVQGILKIAADLDIIASFPVDRRFIVRFKQSYLDWQPSEDDEARDAADDDADAQQFEEESWESVLLNDDELPAALAEVGPIPSAYLFAEPETPSEAILSSPLLADASVYRCSELAYTITAAGTHKGTGLRDMAQRLGIPLSETMAVGNDENDIPLFEAAAYGVAVAYASPPTLESADAVVASVWDAGVAEALRRFAF